MDVVELTRELIKIDSQNPPGNERAVAFYIKDFLADAGIPAKAIEYDKDRFDVIASIGSGEGLLLQGHMDTVPFGDLKRWSYHPLEGRIVGGRIYGRGASDMKAGIAAVLIAAKKLARESFKKRLALAFVGDEEVGLTGSTYLIKNRRDFLKGIKYGLIAEPTDLKIVVAQKGVMHLRFQFRGRAAHGSRPWLGDNAILKASKFIQEIENLSEKLKRVKDPFLGYGTLNVGKITGGTKVNIVPDYCEVEVDRRLLPSESPEAVLGQFRDILKKLKLEAEIKLLIKPRQAMKLPKESEIVQVMKELTKAELVGEHGYTEAELFYREAGIEVVAFGPGNSAHQTNEWVKMSDVKKVATIYEKLIRRFCL